MPTMHTLEKKFAQMGARVKVGEIAPSAWNRRRITIDVRRDGRGEYFVVDTADGVDAEVVNVDASDRHLLLHLRDGRAKSKFLCGHDERHWFVAAVPESAPGVTTVAKAKEALQPDGVRNSTKKVRAKKRLSRRNEVFVRQGEWYFTPDPAVAPEPYLIHRNEPIWRSGRRGGKPHTIEYLYRSGGETVYMRVSGGQTISPAEYGKLSSKERGMWSPRTVPAGVWAKGKVSHEDHATITLVGWHRIQMNTEQRASAMAHVAFVD